MKNYCGAAAPNIRLACKNFRIFESTASDGYDNSCKPNARFNLSGINNSYREREITFQFVKRQLMDGKINYGVYHEHVMDLYEFKQPEKLLSDLTDSSATE